MHKEKIRILFQHGKSLGTSYLDKSAQENLGVQCSDLDLRTGQASDNSPTYISPLPIAQIDTVLNTTKPWNLYNFVEKDYVNYTAALQMWGILAVWLDSNYDEEKEGLLQYTNWKLR